MKEEWKPVKGYEGLYEVSNMGRVKSLNYKRTGKEGILKGLKNTWGYLYVQLYKDGKMKNCKIHRLVGQAFLENPEGYTDLNHLDENKENNRADNLEWCSKSYNINYGTRNKRVAEKVSEKLRGRKGRKLSEEHKKKIGKKNSKPVFSVNKESGLIMYWESAMEAERCTGIANSNICKCLKGKAKSAGGHIWFYADDNE